MVHRCAEIYRVQYSGCVTAAGAGGVRARAWGGGPVPHNTQTNTHTHARTNLPTGAHKHREGHTRARCSRCDKEGRGTGRDVGDGDEGHGVWQERWEGREEGGRSGRQVERERRAKMRSISQTRTKWEKQEMEQASKKKKRKRKTRKPEKRGGIASYPRNRGCGVDPGREGQEKTKQTTRVVDAVWKKGEAVSRPPLVCAVQGWWLLQLFFGVCFPCVCLTQFLLSRLCFALQRRAVRSCCASLCVGSISVG